MSFTRRQVGSYRVSSVSALVLNYGLISARRGIIAIIELFLSQRFSQVTETKPTHFY